MPSGGRAHAGLSIPHGMVHAQSSQDIQCSGDSSLPLNRADTLSDDGTVLSSSYPMHRTRSFPALDSCASLEALSNVSDASAGGSPLRFLTVQKARSRGYLVNNTGSALLLGAEQLDACLPQRQVSVLVGTWNMNGKDAPASLDDLILPERLSYVPDLVAVGTQESQPDHRALHVSLQSTLGASHVLLHAASLGTLQLCLFIRRDLIWHCSVCEDASYSIRQPTAIKTKGCVAIGFQLFGSSLLFLTCHLTAHLEKENQRIVDARRICAALDLPRQIPKRCRSGDVTERYDSVFWFGDLNFRLARSRPQVIDTLLDSARAMLLHPRPPPPHCMYELLQHDQLNHAKRKGRVFESYREGDICFVPTYKYDPGTSNFDTSSKQRVPAYTDRILYRSRRDTIRCVQYDSVQDFTTSDHKPVWGLYQCQIRPSLDNIPLAAGQFNRSVFLDGLQHRVQHLPRPKPDPSRPGCTVQ